MKPKLVKVISPNKMLFIKGRLVRSPLNTIVKFENQLSLLKNSLKLQAAEYTIEDYVEKKEPIVEKKLEKEKEQIKISKKDQPKTTLEKISSETE